MCLLYPHETRKIIFANYYICVPHKIAVDCCKLIFELYSFLYVVEFVEKKLKPVFFYFSFGYTKTR